MIYIRSRFSEPNAKGQLGIGVPPNELWGVAQGPHKRQRGQTACARRAAKRAAKRLNITLKSYLRQQAKGAKRRT